MKKTHRHRSPKLFTQPSCLQLCRNVGSKCLSFIFLLTGAPHPKSLWKISSVSEACYIFKRVIFLKWSENPAECLDLLHKGLDVSTLSSFITGICLILWSSHFILEYIYDNFRSEQEGLAIGLGMKTIYQSCLWILKDSGNIHINELILF